MEQHTSSKKFCVLSVWRHPKLFIWTRIIALGAAFSFVLPIITWAFDSANYLSSNPYMIQVQLLGKNLKLPEKFGKIQKGFQGQNRMIVHVQDLHCNHEVQMNIARIIHYLAQEHELGLVGEEGAFYTVNTSKLRTFPIPEIREDVGDYLVQQGKLSGAEYYSATGEHPVRLEGIETPDLYHASARQVRSFLNSESQGLSYDLRELLDELKPSIYNPRLLKYDDKCSDYRLGRSELLVYARHLYTMAKKLHIPLTSYIQLTRFLAFKQNIFSEKIDADSLFFEFERLDIEIRSRLYSDERQQELDILLHRVDVIERLLSISVKPEELQDFRENRGQYQTRVFLEFAAQHSPAGETKFEFDSWEFASLDQYLDQVETFYRLADERSQHFVENLAAKMERFDENLAVMISGGFHTEKVLHELESRNISYVSIKPRLTRQDIVNPYFSLLQNRKLPLEKLLARNQDIMAVLTECADLPNIKPTDIINPAQLRGKKRIARRMKDVLLKNATVVNLTNIQKVPLPEIPDAYLALLKKYLANGETTVDWDIFIKENQAMVQELKGKELPLLMIPVRDESGTKVTTLALLDIKQTPGPSNHELQRIRLGSKNPVDYLYYGDPKQGAQALEILLKKSQQRQVLVLLPDGAKLSDFFGWQGRMLKIMPAMLMFASKIKQKWTRILNENIAQEAAKQTGLAPAALELPQWERGFFKKGYLKQTLSRIPKRWRPLLEETFFRVLPMLQKVPGTEAKLSSHQAMMKIFHAVLNAPESFAKITDEILPPKALEGKQDIAEWQTALDERDQWVIIQPGFWKDISRYYAIGPPMNNQVIASLNKWRIQYYIENKKSWSAREFDKSEDPREVVSPERGLYPFVPNATLLNLTPQELVEMLNEFFENMPKTSLGIIRAVPHFSILLGTNYQDFPIEDIPEIYQNIITECGADPDLKAMKLEVTGLGINPAGDLVCYLKYHVPVKGDKHALVKVADIAKKHGIKQQSGKNEQFFAMNLAWLGGTIPGDELKTVVDYINKFNSEHKQDYNKKIFNPITDGESFTVSARDPMHWTLEKGDILAGDVETFMQAQKVIQAFSEKDHVTGTKAPFNLLHNSFAILGAIGIAVYATLVDSSVWLSIFTWAMVGVYALHGLAGWVIQNVGAAPRGRPDDVTNPGVRPIDDAPKTKWQSRAEQYFRNAAKVVCLPTAEMEAMYWKITDKQNEAKSKKRTRWQKWWQKWLAPWNSALTYRDPKTGKFTVYLNHGWVADSQSRWFNLLRAIMLPVTLAHEGSAIVLERLARQSARHPILRSVIRFFATPLRYILRPLQVISLYPIWKLIRNKLTELSNAAETVPVIKVLKKPKNVSDKIQTYPDMQSLNLATDEQHKLTATDREILQTVFQNGAISSLALTGLLHRIRSPIIHIFIYAFIPGLILFYSLFASKFMGLPANELYLDPFQYKTALRYLRKGRLYVKSFHMDMSPRHTFLFYKTLNRYFEPADKIKLIVHIEDIDRILEDFAHRENLLFDSDNFEPIQMAMAERAFDNNIILLFEPLHLAKSCKGVAGLERYVARIRTWRESWSKFHPDRHIPIQIVFDPWHWISNGYPELYRQFHQTTLPGKTDAIRFEVLEILKQAFTSMQDMVGWIHFSNEKRYPYFSRLFNIIFYRSALFGNKTLIPNLMFLRFIHERKPELLTRITFELNPVYFIHALFGFEGFIRRTAKKKDDMKTRPGGTPTEEYRSRSKRGKSELGPHNWQQQLKPRALHRRLDALLNQKEAPFLPALAIHAPPSLRGYTNVLIHGIGEINKRWQGSSNRHDKPLITFTKIIGSKDGKVDKKSDQGVTIIQWQGSAEEEQWLAGQLPIIEKSKDSQPVILIIHRPEELYLRYGKEKVRQVLDQVNAVVMLINDQEWIKRYQEMMSGKPVVYIPHGFISKGDLIDEQRLRSEAVSVVGAITDWGSIRKFEDVKKLVNAVYVNNPGKNVIGFIAGGFDNFIDLKKYQQDTDNYLFLSKNEMRSAYSQKEFSDEASFRRWLLDKSNKDYAGNLDDKRRVIIWPELFGPEDMELSKWQENLIDFKTAGIHHEVLNEKRPAEDKNKTKMEPDGTCHRTAGPAIQIWRRGSSSRSIQQDEGLRIVEVPNTDIGEIDFKVGAQRIIELLNNPNKRRRIVEHNLRTGRALSMSEIAYAYVMLGKWLLESLEQDFRQEASTGGIMPDEFKHWAGKGKFWEKHYSTLVAWWWEFCVSLKQWYAWVPGLAFAGMALYMFGDIDLALKVFLGPVWVSFSHLHFKQKASRTNKIIAVIFSVVNIALIFMPFVSFPVMLAFGLLGHGLVNISALIIREVPKRYQALVDYTLWRLGEIFELNAVQNAWLVNKSKHVLWSVSIVGLFGVVAGMFSTLVLVWIIGSQIAKLLWLVIQSPRILFEMKPGDIKGAILALVLSWGLVFGTPILAEPPGMSGVAANTVQVEELLQQESAISIDLAANVTNNQGRQWLNENGILTAKQKQLLIAFIRKAAQFDIERLLDILEKTDPKVRLALGGSLSLSWWDTPEKDIYDEMVKILAQEKRWTILLRAEGHSPANRQARLLVRLAKSYSQYALQHLDFEFERRGESFLREVLREIMLLGPDLKPEIRQRAFEIVKQAVKDQSIGIELKKAYQQDSENWGTQWKKALKSWSELNPVYFQALERALQTPGQDKLELNVPESEIVHAETEVREALDAGVEVVGILNRHFRLWSPIVREEYGINEQGRKVMVRLIRQAGQADNNQAVRIVTQLDHRLVNFAGGTLRLCKAIGPHPQMIKAMAQNADAVAGRILSEYPYGVSPQNQFIDISESDPESGKIIKQSALEQMRRNVSRMPQAEKSSKNIAIWSSLVDSVPEVLEFYSYAQQIPNVLFEIDANPIMHLIRYDIQQKEIEQLPDIALYVLLARGQNQINSRTFNLLLPELRKRARVQGRVLLEYLGRLDFDYKLTIEFLRVLQAFDEVKHALAEYPVFFRNMASILFKRVDSIKDDKYVAAVRLLHEMLGEKSTSRQTGEQDVNYESPDTQFLRSLSADETMAIQLKENLADGMVRAHEVIKSEEIKTTLRLLLGVNLARGNIPESVHNRIMPLLEGVDISEIARKTKESGDLPEGLVQGPSLMIYSPDHRAFYKETIKRYTGNSYGIGGYIITKQEKNITLLTYRTKPEQQIVLVHLAPDMLDEMGRMKTPLPQLMKKYGARMVFYRGHGYESNLNQVFSGIVPEDWKDETVLIGMGSCRSDNAIGMPFFNQFAKVMFISQSDISEGTLNDIVYWNYIQQIHQGETDSDTISKIIRRKKPKATENVHFPGDQIYEVLRIRDQVQAMNPNSIAFFLHLIRHPGDITGAVAVGKRGLKWEIPVLLILGAVLGLMGLHVWFAVFLAAFALVHQYYKWRAGLARGAIPLLAGWSKQILAFAPYFAFSLFLALNGWFWGWVIVLGLLATGIHVSYDFWEFDRMARNLTGDHKKTISTAYSSLVDIDLSKIQKTPNEYVLAGRSWLLKRLPNLRLGLIFVLSVVQGLRQQLLPGPKNLDLEQHPEALGNKLGQRIISQLPPNRFALSDLLRANREGRCIEVRTLPENMNGLEYIVRLVRGECWQRVEKGEKADSPTDAFALYLPTGLSSSLAEKMSRGDSLGWSGLLFDHIAAFAGERYYQKLRGHFRLAEHLQQQVSADPRLGPLFVSNTPTGKRWQQALGHLAMGKSTLGVGGLSRLLLKALLESDDQQLDHSLLKLLGTVDSGHSVKVVITVEQKKISIVLPAVVIERQNLLWLLQQKYPQGIIRIDKQRIKLLPIILHKTPAQAA